MSGSSGTDSGSIFGNETPSSSTWDYFGQFENYRVWQDSIVTDYGGNPESFQYSAVRFFAENLIPFMHIMNTVFFAIGFVFIIMGVMRMKQHGNHGSGKNVAPVGTIFYFISGVMLMNYAPFMTAISNSLFDYGATDFTDFSNSLQNSKSILYYVQQIKAAGNDQTLIMKQITFGLLMIVGVFSFCRGLMLLVKMGEGGGGQEGGPSKAVTHILAGLVGINGMAFWKLMNSIVPLTGSSS
jgi:hypothetical protein